MNVLDIISLAIAILGVAFGLRCYLELWRWARQCQHARIAIAYKRKVKLQAPLIEWLAWINQMDADKHSNGRVVYTVGGTSVAITKAVIPPGRIRTLLNKRKAKTAPVRGGMQARTGTWSAKDETPKQNVTPVTRNKVEV